MAAANPSRLSAGRLELTHSRGQGRGWTPGRAQGASLWNRMQTSVCEHLPGSGGLGEPTAPIRLSQGLRPLGSSELLVSQHEAGPSGAPKSSRLEMARDVGRRTGSQILGLWKGYGGTGASVPGWWPLAPSS